MPCSSVFFAPLRLCVSFLLLGFGTAAADEPRVVTNTLGMKFVRIPAGEFLMGSPKSDEEANADERPQHRVHISRAFYLGVHEVTRGEYERVVGELPGSLAPTMSFEKNEQRPEADDSARFAVDNVSWDEATLFCTKLATVAGELTAGFSYRLPTEAEWEYACRAGTTTRYGYGDHIGAMPRHLRVANFIYPSPRMDYSGPFFPPAVGIVGYYPPNTWGLHDMHGNVWEWCSDAYSPDTYEADVARAVNAITVDPQGPAEGTGRVIRGGDYRSKPTEARSANRDFTRQSRRDLGNGFRVVLSIDER